MELQTYLRNPDLTLIADSTMYLGGANFCVFDSSNDEDPEWALWLASQFLGYDCWAFLGRLNNGNTCVGAFVLPFGPWTMDHPEIVDRLDETPAGSVVDVSDVVDLFPETMRVTATFSSVEDIIVAPGPDLELPVEEGKGVAFGLRGDLTMIASGDDGDWIEGPVLILRAELVS